MSTLEPITDEAAVLERLQVRRHSCRGFRPEVVDREVVIRLLTMAQHAPSWCNTQPWQVFITEGEGTESLRKKLHGFGTTSPPQPDIPFPARYTGEFDARRKACAWQLYESVGIEYGDRAASREQTFKNFELFGAPHLAVVTSERDQGTYGAVDCGIYVANFLLAAEALGLGAIPQAGIAACAPVLREHLALPDERIVLCGISFGYEDDEHPANGFRTERADIDDVVTWVVA